MVQNPKSGGLSSTLGANQIGGVQKTTDFLEKATWTLAGTLVVLILLSGIGSFSGSSSSNFVKDNELKTVPTKTEKPVTTPAPAANPAEKK